MSELESYAAADELDLLPTPREISLAETRHDLAGWDLVIPSNVPFREVVISELHDRVADVGGRPLPVRTRLDNRPAIIVGRWLDPVVDRVASALDVTVTPSDPGEQGYHITFGSIGDQHVALLAGSDAQGMLYAAVTARRLLESWSEGAAIREATIRDWPDYTRRSNGRLRIQTLLDVPVTLGDLTALDDAAAALKRQIDHFLRHKVNYVHTSGFQPRADADPRLLHHRAERVNEVFAYAHERGIATRFPGGVEIGDYLKEEEREQAVERHEGTSYLWAALDAHRRHAEDVASGFPDGAGMYSLHPYDGGGYLNPENWDKRSPATEEMYGDDRALADVEQFMLYFSVIRDAHPGIGREAVVYPYHFQFAREDFPESYEALAEWMPSKGGWYGSLEDAAHAETVQDELLAYFQSVDDQLPSDVQFVFREAGEAEFEAAIELLGDRRLNLWVYPARNKGWLGTFTPQIRWLPITYYRDDRDDYFYLPFAMTRTGDRRVVRLAQQEYLWAVDRPDAEPIYENRLRWYEHGGQEISEFQQSHLIPRIARILYGETAEAQADLIADNVSLHYVAHPEYVSEVSHETEYFEDPDQYMAEQAAAFDRHAETFGDTVKSDEDASSSTCQKAWAIFYWRYATIAAAKAHLRAVASEAEALLEDGDTSEAASKATSGLDELPTLREQLESVRNESQERFASLPPLYANAPPFGAELEEEIAGGPSYGGDRLLPLESFDGVEEETRLQAVVAATEGDGT